MIKHLIALLFLHVAAAEPLQWGLRSSTVLHLYWIGKPGHTYELYSGATPTSITNLIYRELVCEHAHTGPDVTLGGSNVFFRLLEITNTPCALPLP